MSKPNENVIVALLSVLLITSIVAGCSNSKLRGTPVSERPTPWFCEMNETRDDWDCVQDAALASNPKPKRLPSDPVEPNPFDGEDPNPGAVDLSGLANPSAAIDFEAIEQAFSADDATKVMEASSDSYTVQLTTTENKPLAVGFMAEHDLQDNDDIMLLELARDDTLYYVVLLGVYLTESAARTAADTRPGSLADVTPWVRPLEPIQADLSQARFLNAGQRP